MGALSLAALACSSGHDQQSEDEFGTVQEAAKLNNNKTFPNATGKSGSFSTLGSINLDGAFFQDVGTNGRTCETCHLAGDGWTVSAQTAQDLFDQTGGLHALFEFDGQNCAGADRSTVEARRAASSLMIDRGVVRFDKAIPPTAEYEVVDWEGTYCNPVTPENIVVYRRPLPTTNFGSLSTVLWDGLGNFIAPNPLDAVGIVVIGATQLHAETTFFPPPEFIADAVTMMATTTNAQVHDNTAKNLTARHALGGPEALAGLPLDGPPGFDIYDSWMDVPGGGTEAARRSVARGQEIFNTRPIQITGVGGLPDVTSTCSGCHRSPNMGNSTSFITMDIGVSDASVRPADLPLYTLRHKVTGETVQSSDPGTALITGLWDDIGKFKVPNLRGLAARAPYFHNGIAETLDDVVDFYDERFGMNLTDQEHDDLVAFLRAL